MSVVLENGDTLAVSMNVDSEGNVRDVQMAKLGSSPPLRLVVRCQDHPSYRGLNDPSHDCDTCRVVHRLRGATTTLRAGANTTYMARVGSA